MNSLPIIKTIDIETSPDLADVWGRWQQNISTNQVHKRGHIMSFAEKTLGEDHAYYAENREGDDKEIVEELIASLDEADFVIGHNMQKFDNRWMLGQAIKYGLTPPSPYRIIDTLKEARKYMYLPSYRLKDLAIDLGCAPKSSHAEFPGHMLWTECLKGNPKAWKEMKDYNVQDVFTTEEVYLKLRPYMKNHPNIGVFMENEETVCGTCGGKHINYRGYYYTNAGKYRKFQCVECGSWGSLRHTEYPKDQRKTLGKNV